MSDRARELPPPPERRRWVAAGLCVCLVLGGCRPAPVPDERRDLHVAVRADPRTFNPVVAIDAVSAGLNALLHGRLFRVDARSQQVVAELAERLDPSPDGRGATVTVRRGVRFPDGEPFGADDVVFSLGVLQDAGLGSPQLHALRVGGDATIATAIDDLTVRLVFGGPHPDPARLLAGIPMLPRHVLEPRHRAGTLAAAWSLGEAPSAIVGLGPFRLQEYTQGQRIVLSRNEAYWRRDEAGRPLPRLDRLTAHVISDADAQVARLLAGQLDMLSALDTRSHAAISAAAAGAGVQVHDLGPSLEYTFLVFNLDDASKAATPAAVARARWFHDDAFRQAVSVAVDRAAIARLAYDGRATPLGSFVSPGNAAWHAGIPAPTRAPDQARDLLARAGFVLGKDGRLRDASGVPVTFSVIASTSNPQRLRIAALLQADLQPLGIDVRVAALEFRALVERVTRTRDFDTAIMALGGGDTDPDAEANVWQLGGTTRLWRLGSRGALADWERDIDRLMRAQAVTGDRGQRRDLYARVQHLVARHLPIVPLVSPNHLVAVRAGLTGVAPGVTSRDSLWNVDEMAWAARPGGQ